MSEDNPATRSPPASTTATNWFGSFSADIGRAFETARDQVVKAADEASPAFTSAMDAVKLRAVKLKEEAVQAAQALHQVAEKAAQEISAEEARIKASSSAAVPPSSLVSLLPWEASDESQEILTQPLMEQILAISHDEATFAPLHAEEEEQFGPFDLENYVTVITRLLSLDPALEKMHARLGGRGREEKEFWQSYFYRCACLRSGCGMGGNAPGGGGRGYEIRGEPVMMPTAAVARKKEDPEAGEEKTVKWKSEALSRLTKEKEASTENHRLNEGGGEGGGRGHGGTSGVSSSSKPAALHEDPAASGKQEPEEMEEKDEEGEQEKDGDGDSMDLEGLGLSDEEEGGDALDGEALEELEAQIAAELEGEGKREEG